MKIHIILVSSPTNHTDSEISAFLNIASFFVFKSYMSLAIMFTGKKKHVLEALILSRMSSAFSKPRLSSMKKTENEMRCHLPPYVRVIYDTCGTRKYQIQNLRYPLFTILYQTKQSSVNIFCQLRGRFVLQIIGKQPFVSPNLIPIRKKKF